MAKAAKTGNAKRIDYLALAAFIILSQLAGALGAVFTFEAIPSWYASLEKPFFTPPAWVFGPVWTTLYLLMGIAAYLVWERMGENKVAKQALYLFGTQLALNSAWSIGFFGLRSPLLGMVIIVLLWLAIVGTMRAFTKVSATAGNLLVPYLAWVSFATLLNAAILILNP
jgi:tryptophan-rich sensory protein